MLTAFEISNYLFFIYVFDFFQYSASSLFRAVSMHVEALLCKFIDHEVSTILNIYPQSGTTKPWSGTQASLKISFSCTYWSRLNTHSSFWLSTCQPRWAIWSAPCVVWNTFCQSCSSISCNSVPTATSPIWPCYKFLGINIKSVTVEPCPSCFFFKSNPSSLGEGKLRLSLALVGGISFSFILS